MNMNESKEFLGLDAVKVIADEVNKRVTKEELESNYAKKEEVTSVLSENGLIGETLIHEEEIETELISEFKLGALKGDNQLTFKYDKGTYLVHSFTEEIVMEINSIDIEIYESSNIFDSVTETVYPNIPVSIPWTNASDLRFMVNAIAANGATVTLHNFQVIKESRVTVNEKDIQILKSEVANLKSKTISGSSFAINEGNITTNLNAEEMPITEYVDNKLDQQNSNIWIGTEDEYQKINTHNNVIYIVK